MIQRVNWLGKSRAVMGSVALAALLALAGCGGTSSTAATTPTDTPAPAATATATTAAAAGSTITMGLTSFTIITITVTPDGHATWQVPPTSPQCCPNPSGCASLSGTTVLDAALTAMVFHDLALAEPFANRQFDYCPDLGGGTSVTFAGQ